MKDEILNIFKENYVVKISFFFIFLFPVILLLGSAILNTAIVIMNIFFLIHVFSEKKFQIFNNDIFYFLFILWVFLITNTLLNDDFNENYSRSFGFIRFILLIFTFSYFMSYKNFQFKNIIFNIWTIIFIIVSLDLIFEFFLGFNSLGFKSAYQGRLSGFMGDELKAGSLLLSISFVTACFLITHTKLKNTSLLLLFIFLITIFITGDRSNFIKLFK